MARVTLTQRVNELSVEVAEVKVRLDKMDLNGHTAALKQLAVAAPALVTLAEAAPSIITKVQVAHENAEFWRVFRKKIGWTKARAVIWMLAVAIAGGFGYWLFNR